MIPYGGFWWRVLAYILDAIILQIATSIIGGIFGVGLALPLTGLGAGENAAFGMMMFGMIGASLVINWLYFAIMEATVGKLAVGVVVTDLRGERLTFARATGRYFAKILSSLILCIGYIMVAFTERKQGLHDIVASTLVYKTRDPSVLFDNREVFA
jgi:uncharacterized RDD family membrane protein YckC